MQLYTTHQYLMRSKKTAIIIGVNKHGLNISRCISLCLTVTQCLLPHSRCLLHTPRHLVHCKNVSVRHHLWNVMLCDVQLQFLQQHRRVVGSFAKVFLRSSKERLVLLLVVLFRLCERCDGVTSVVRLYASARLPLRPLDCSLTIVSVGSCVSVDDTTGSMTLTRSPRQLL